jgi:hypothetical protein
MLSCISSQRNAAYNQVVLRQPYLMSSMLAVCSIIIYCSVHQPSQCEASVGRLLPIHCGSFDVTPPLYSLLHNLTLPAGPCAARSCRHRLCCCCCMCAVCTANGLQHCPPPAGQCTQGLLKTMPCQVADLLTIGDHAAAQTQHLT